MDFLSVYDKYKNVAEGYFEKVFNDGVDRSLLTDAVKYSFFGGGKRLRPVLMLAVSDYLGVNFDKVLPFAFSVECIHEHSLIHDDLPSVDNDDYRRGKPSCHKVFGESNALLAGDYLLNFAYYFLFHGKCEKFEYEALSVLSDATLKMLEGQALDTAFKGDYDEETVLNVYSKKTCALLNACFMIPNAVSEDLSESVKRDLKKDFGVLSYNLGVLFQITDDLLDYNEIKNDTTAKELNFVCEFGLERTLQLKLHFERECYKITDKYKDFTFLKHFVDFVSERIV